MQNTFYIGYGFTEMYKLYAIMHWDDQVKESACFWDGGSWTRGAQVTTTIAEIIFVKKSEKITGSSIWMLLSIAPSRE